MLRPNGRILVAALAALTLAACNNEDGGGTGVIPPGNATLTTNITVNRTLYKDTLYTLQGFIQVTNGATLTIQPARSSRATSPPSARRSSSRAARASSPTAPPPSRSSSPRRGRSGSGRPATGAAWSSSATA
jgi:predicted small secreted protein